MPSRDWRQRIQDIWQSITEILQRTGGMEFKDFMQDRTIIKALLYDFGIIGEAVTNILADIQPRYSQTGTFL